MDGNEEESASAAAEPAPPAVEAAAGPAAAPAEQPPQPAGQEMWENRKRGSPEQQEQEPVSKAPRVQACGEPQAEPGELVRAAISAEALPAYRNRSRKRLTPGKKAELKPLIEDMRASKKSWKEIQSHFGVDKQVARRILDTDFSAPR